MIRPLPISRSPWRSPSHRHLFVAAALCALLAAAWPALADWPQWRGAGGRGVAPDAVPLPTSWAPDGPNVRWRTEIPGEGISSPIVSGGRVFVTTAYEGPQSLVVERAGRWASVLLALAVVALVVASRRGGTAAGRWDRRFVVLASLLAALLGTVVAVQPDLLFKIDNPSRVWRTGGAIALLSIAAAFGWSRRDSRWRLAALPVVAAGAAAMIALMPSGALGAKSLEKGLPVAVPSLALAVWYLVAYRKARRAAEAPVAPRPASPWAALPLALLAVLAFVPHNLLNTLQRAVVALDLESGELLWETPAVSGPPEQKWPHSSYATPTPASDGEAVYAYFGHGIARVDFDGTLRWSREFPDYAHHTRYGAATSPVLAGDTVIVVQEQESFQDAPPSFILALDKETGEERWRVSPPDAHDSYGTPAMVGSPSGEVLLTPSWKVLVAYDAATGERLWSWDYPMEQMVASLGRAGDLMALTGGAYGDRRLMVFRVAGDAGPGDGGTEPGAPERAGTAGSPGSDSGAGSEPSGAAASAEVELLWDTNRRVATIVSPVIYGGQVFTVTTSPGVMTSYDALTGDELWKTRLPGEYYASLVAGDGKVYASSSEGTVVVVAASPELEQLAENEMGEEIFATPAIAGGCLIVRTAAAVYCIEA